jgi:ribosomal protein L9
MSEAIPQTLEFHRQPNSSSTTSYLPKHSSETGEPAAALSPTASDQRVQADSLSIYGSVSALDIIKYIKTKLDESPDGARVVPLSSEDIRFTSTLSEVEPERIKHLGEFEVEIKLKGSQEPILRTIKVLPEI